MLPTKILAVHNRYRQRGGEDEVFEREVALLRQKGHAVLEFVEDNEQVDAGNPLRNGLNAIWARDTASRMAELIRKERPEIVHFHNTFARISPAAYYACRQAGVPVVQTLHNFRTGCLNACCATEQGPCERCVPHLIPLAGIVKGCYRNSRSASLAMAAITTTHKVLGTYRKQVDAFIALTEFARRIQIRSGIPQEKVFVKPNFTEPQPASPDAERRFALFVGRLCPEKGITTLLEAWKRAAPSIPLRIAGDGPSATEVAAAAASTPGIEWLGARSHAEVMDLMRQAQFLVMPSRLYESFGLCIIEAFSAGVPCIVSGHGSMQELVADGTTGLHFQPGNPQDLAAKIQWMTENVIQRKQMSQAALTHYQANFTPDQNYRILMEIYGAARVKFQAPKASILSGIAEQEYVYQGNNGTPIS